MLPADIPFPRAALFAHTLVGILYIIHIYLPKSMPLIIIAVTCRRHKFTFTFFIHLHSNPFVFPSACKTLMSTHDSKARVTTFDIALSIPACNSEIYGVPAV